MYVLLVLGLTSFSLCLLLTPLCRDLALRYNLVDRPDEDRKLHGRPIPRIGGVPIVLAYVGTLVVIFAFAPAHQKLYIQHKDLLWLLLPATAIVFLTGLLDDLIGLKPWQKLLGQLVAAGLAVGLGTHFTTTNSHFFAHHAALATPWLIYPISIVWLIGCTNAVNLIDGLDGLASGVGLFATVTTLLVAIFTGDAGLMLATLPLAGCLLAFLCFNFSPASIFLGDSGSLTIGFALGCFTLIWSQRTGTIMGLVAPLIALALPLVDVGLAICRRYLRHVPIFKGDRGHIHHMVLARGYKPRTTALILYGVCAAAASIALLLSFSPAYVRMIIVVVFLLLVCAGIHYLDYIELGAAWRAVSSQRVLRQVRDDIYLRDLERSVLSAESAEGCWLIVRRVCAELQFDTVEMLLHEIHFEHGSSASESLSWRITLPLGERGYLKLCRSGCDRPAKLMMATVERLQEDLTKKAVTMAGEPYLVKRSAHTTTIGRHDRSGAA
jgi:UDP-GlcNAc:undecaprenyl-phosphate GlcNAc-1-phosphate transferase